MSAERIESKGLPDGYEPPSGALTGRVPSPWLPSDHKRDHQDCCTVCIYPGSLRTIGGPAPMGWGHCPHNPRRIPFPEGMARTEPIERSRRG